jgi:hypothetical protein
VYRHRRTIAAVLVGVLALPFLVELVRWLS